MNKNSGFNQNDLNMLLNQLILNNLFQTSISSNNNSSNNFINYSNLIINSNINIHNNYYINSIITQIGIFISYNREFSDNIVTQLATFIEKNFSLISIDTLINLLSKILNVLLENNLSITNFMNKIFPILIQIISKKNRKKDEIDKIINIIGKFTKMCIKYQLSQIIESNVNSIFERFFSINDNNNSNNKDYIKYFLLSLISEFLISASVISYNKIIENFDKFVLTIKNNFNNNNKEYFIKEAFINLLENFLKLEQ